MSKRSAAFFKTVKDGINKHIKEFKWIISFFIALLLTITVVLPTRGPIGTEESALECKAILEKYINDPQNTTIDFSKYTLTNTNNFEWVVLKNKTDDADCTAKFDTTTNSYSYVTNTHIGDYIGATIWGFSISLTLLTYLVYYCFISVLIVIYKACTYLISNFYRQYKKNKEELEKLENTKSEA